MNGTCVGESYLTGLRGIGLNVLIALRHCPDGERTIVPAKSKTIRQYFSNAHFARLVGDVIQIAIGIGCLIIDRRMDDVVADHQRTGDRLDTAARSQKMADHALGAAHCQFVSVRTKHFLDCPCLCCVAELGAGSVSVEILDILGVPLGHVQRACSIALAAPIPCSCGAVMW